MKIRDYMKVSANDETTIFCKKKDRKYKSKYHITVIVVNHVPKQIICKNRTEAVTEIIRLLKVLGWKLDKIKKL